MPEYRSSPPETRSLVSMEEKVYQAYGTYTCLEFFAMNQMMILTMHSAEERSAAEVVFIGLEVLMANVSGIKHIKKMGRRPHANDSSKRLAIAKSSLEECFALFAFVDATIRIIRY